MAARCLSVSLLRSHDGTTYMFEGTTHVGSHAVPVAQALADIPPARAGWVLFADQDVLCDEMGFKMPFTKYEGKDLVLWGSAKLVREDAYQRLLSVSHKDRQQGVWLVARHPI